MLTKYRLYTPGPTSVPPETLAALAKPVHHHRTAEFRAMFDRVNENLRYVYQTERPVYTITGSGTSAFEAGFVSTVKPGAKVLNVTNGKFAERWASYAKTFGCELTEMELEYGTHVTPEQMAEALGKGPYDAVVLVHSETSTGTACDLEKVAKAVRDKGGDAVLIVDGITSIGAMPFHMDGWGVDVAITGSQKSLMLPPGLGFVSLSERAEAAMDANAGQPRFYVDLRAYRKSLEKGDTPYTPANTLIEGLGVSLQMIRDETLETVWRRTAACAEAFRHAMVALGMDLFSRQPSDSVSAVRFPAGVSDKDFRGTLKAQHNVHVANGQGTMEGQIFRVNHMGYSDVYDALAVIAAIEFTLKSLGQPVQLGTGVTAAQQVLAELF